MKKLLAAVFCLALLLATVPTTAVSAATTGTVDGIQYKIDGGQVTLTGYTSALPSTLVIPSTIEGYPVTTIGYSAFEDADITSVTIPDSVLFLDDYAFAWCYYLKTATVGHGVTTIDYGAFSYTGLTSITIGRGAVNISDYTFMSCRKMTNVTIDAANPVYCSVNGVLYNKAMTRLIYYPGDKAGSYTIPEGVTAISGNAFSFCDAVTALYLPSTITYVSGNIFFDCGGLAALHVAAANPSLCSDNGVVFTKDMSTLMVCPSGKSGAYTIPQGVTAIHGNAFEHCENLTSITIPNSVITIGESAFSYCHGLTSIVIPDSVTTIGDYLFYDCNNLVFAHVGDGITRLSQMTFYDCPKLSSIRLPDTLTYIGYKAIWDTAYYNNTANWKNNVLYYGHYLIDTNSKLTGDYVIPDGTTVVAEYSFHGRNGVTSVTIPEGVRAIEYSTFSTCEKLTAVTLPKSLTYIGEWAFSYCTKLKDVYYGGTEADRSNIEVCAHNDSLKNVTWHYSHVSEPESGITGDCVWVLEDGHLTISGEGKMADYTRNDKAPWGEDVVSVTIEDGVTSIGNYAFADCESLSSVTIPDSITIIGDYAFDFCESLSSVSIPTSVTDIGQRAFSYCSALTSVIIPDSVTTIGASAFCGCTTLSSVTLSKNLTALPDSLFVACAYLTDIVIPDSVTTLGRGIFDCSGLVSIVIPDGVTTIPDYTFSGCYSLTSVTIPDGVTTIGECAFLDCPSLPSITLPASIATIGESAFFDCYSLSDVYYNGSAADWDHVIVSAYNDALLNATRHYTDPTILGDANGDGRVNNRDLGILQQHLADWEITIDLAAVDMDGNSRINNRDLGLLQQLLNE